MVINTLQVRQVTHTTWQMNILNETHFAAKDAHFCPTSSCLAQMTRRAESREKKKQSKEGVSAGADLM